MRLIAAVDFGIFQVGDFFRTALRQRTLPSGQRTAIINRRQFSKSLKNWMACWSVFGLSMLKQWYDSNSQSSILLPLSGSP
jgi:hypothetical protein